MSTPYEFEGLDLARKLEILSRDELLARWEAMPLQEMRIEMEAWTSLSIRKKHPEWFGSEGSRMDAVDELIEVVKTSAENNAEREPRAELVSQGGEIDLANPPPLPPGDEPWAVVWDPAVDGDQGADPVVRERWRRRRGYHLGASDVAAILGIHPHRACLEAYVDKTEFPPDQDNQFKRWGRIVETHVGEEVARQVGRRYRPDGRILVSRAHPWLSCTLDGYLDRDADLLEVPEFQELPDEVQTEIKSTRFRGPWRESIPPHVKAQVNQQMLIGVGKHSAVGVFFFEDRDTDWDLMEVDQKFLMEILLPLTEEFWHRCINRDPPPAEGMATGSIRAALASMFPLSIESKVVTLDDVYAELELERSALKKKVKACENRLDVIETKLIAACGDAEKMYFPLTDVTLPYKTTKRRGYTVEPTQFRQFGTRKED